MKKAKAYEQRRDIMSAILMAGMYASGRVSFPVGKEHCRNIAQKAVSLTDALIEELDKEVKDNG